MSFLSNDTYIYHCHNNVLSYTHSYLINFKLQSVHFVKLLVKYYRVAVFMQIGGAGLRYVCTTHSGWELLY